MSSAPEAEADSATRQRIERIILTALDAGQSGRTLCPTEIARALAAQDANGAAPAEAWRGWLKPVRRCALALAGEGRIAIYRKGRPVTDPATVKGVIRLGRPAPGGADDPSRP